MGTSKADDIHAASGLREVKVYLSAGMYEDMRRQLQEGAETASGYVRRLIARDVMDSARARQHYTGMDT